MARTRKLYDLTSEQLVTMLAYAEHQAAKTRSLDRRGRHLRAAASYRAELLRRSQLSQRGEA